MIIMILNDNNGSIIPSIFVFSPFLFVENASCPLFFFFIKFLVFIYAMNCFVSHSLFIPHLTSFVVTLK